MLLYHIFRKKSLKEKPLDMFHIPVVSICI